ncbi:MAG: aminopeptidase N [Magnetococcales bacterium]|nr:aminopeptidase N [Magnetococcales bacterium]NGZ26392.1 aminopeptidase N [Magnetococcales bacterium]
MGETAHPVIRLQDYQPPVYLVDHVELTFRLAAKATQVTCRMRMHRADGLAVAPPLRLLGRHLQLNGVRLDDTTLGPDDYQLDEESLTLPTVPGHFILEVQTTIFPDQNTALEGLYLSNNLLCTQCEAEGFRRITYFPDRPDVMASFRTILIAEQDSYPILLANGNRTASGPLEDGHHFAIWEDPFPKPCYLFALVAGNLICEEDYFITRSGRRVTLQLYMEQVNQGRGDHALQSLKKAMAWDENRFGREYDLDIYMVVAVNDFNAGAMENKGLNIFNSKYVLADPQIATDDDYGAVEAVIAHEYFHNWTGNRITCRDWFQLSLKEGLTVFREHLFSEEEGQAAVVRIQCVKGLRTHQFQEDAGPTAHPVQPDSYMEINNFYTTTIYEKGAEVSRMLWILCGDAGFRKGMDLYFKRHDGQAVTIEDFVNCMAVANGRDFSQFMLWYKQAGTPQLTLRSHYQSGEEVYTLSISQKCPATPGQEEKAAMHIPVTMALLDATGAPMPLQLAGEEDAPLQRVLEVTEDVQVFHFQGIKERPVPSLLRGFSAPVKLDMDYSDRELAFLWANDQDPFCRWDAGQRIIMNLLMDAIHAYPTEDSQSIPPGVLETYKKTLSDPHIDPAMATLSLSLPSEVYLLDQLQRANPEAVHQVRKGFCQALSRHLRGPLLAAYRFHQQEPPYRYTPGAAGHRSFKNLALDFLLANPGPEEEEMAFHQFMQANNMTDRLRALTALAYNGCEKRQEALDLFFEKWRHEPLVVNKWLSIQAAAPLPDTLARVTALLDHPSYNGKNPNNVRALVGAFTASNPSQFHRPDGSGYAFLARQILITDTINSHLSARLVGAFRSWRRFDEKRQKLMLEILEEIARTPNLSRDTTEIVGKLLA